MLEGVIFDMDGVIIETEPIYAKRRMAFFHEYGLSVPNTMNQAFAGSNAKLVFQTLIPNQPEEQARALQAYLNFKENYPISVGELIDEDIYPVLDYLKGCGVKIAIASSSTVSEIEETISVGEIAEYFDLIVSGEEFPMSKPHPAIYQATSQRLKLKPSNLLTIEDSVYGIQAAQAASIPVVAKKTDFIPLTSVSPDYQINRLIELEKIIEEIGV